MLLNKQINKEKEIKMNLDDIYSNTTLVFSYFDISPEELNKLSALATMNGEELLSNKIKKIVENLSSVILVEEDFEEKQLQLPFDTIVKPEVTS
tara:strand:+ start:2086 stop:2367 length:282 start_codon:yes stop_codon:yes gene_type:complete